MWGMRVPGDPQETVGVTVSMPRPALQRAGVLARAAAEEVKAASTNGAPAKPSQAALDFDELTELIK